VLLPQSLARGLPEDRLAQPLDRQGEGIRIEANAGLREDEPAEPVALRSEVEIAKTVIRAPRAAESEAGAGDRPHRKQGERGQHAHLLRSTIGLRESHQVARRRTPQDVAPEKEPTTVPPIVTPPLCRKVELLEREKEAVVMQWKAIADEMSKQKTILSSLQQEVENYQSYIAQQNAKQN
jgi:hypothetical protein